MERTSTVTHNGKKYKVIFEDNGMVWFQEPESDIRKSIGKIIGKIRTIEEAEAAVKEMLDRNAY